MPDWRVIPAGCEEAGCEAAGCKGCRKEASSQRILVSEELLAWLMSSEELHSQLIVCKELQAKHYLCLL
jgi:hypothetical protein